MHSQIAQTKSHNHNIQISAQSFVNSIFLHSQPVKESNGSWSGHITEIPNWPWHEPPWPEKDVVGEFFDWMVSPSVVDVVDDDFAGFAAGLPRVEGSFAGGVG